jgi:putative ABC transport system permease protein
MGTRSRKILRDILARKARTALVSISIFIGVLGVVTLTSTGDILINKLHEDLDENELPMMGVGIEPDEGIKADEIDYQAFFDYVRTYPGVTAVMAWAGDRVYWREPADIGFVEGSIRGFSDPLDAMSIEPVTLIEGRYPEVGQQELVIERRMADKFGLQVGDPLVLRILDQLTGRPGAVMAIPEETWTITGIVFHPYIGDSNRQSIYAHFEDVTHIANLDHYSVFMACFTNFPTARDSLEDFEAFINDTTSFKVRWIWADNPAYNEFILEMQDWTNTLKALAIIAMLVSSFLVVTVISTIVIEQKRQIGVMKSMGATRWDNFRMYAGMAVMYGVIGTIPGVLLGIPAGYYLAQEVSPLMNVLLEEFAISYPAVISGAVMGLAMPFFAALLPVILGTRVTIREAITDFGITSRYGGGPVSRGIGRLPVPVAARQALANIYQKKGRLSMTGVTLTLAVGAFMGVSAVFISLDNELGQIFDTFNVDMTVYPVSPEEYDYDTVGTLIGESVEGVNGVYPQFNLGAQIVVAEAPEPDMEDVMRYVWINGFDPATSTIQNHLEAGTGWKNDPTREGIVLTSALAADIGQGVGDTITLRYEDNEIEVEIIGIDTFLDTDDAFMRWETVAALAGEDSPSGYWVRFEDDSVTGADVDRKIGALREALLQNGIIPDFDNLRAEEEEVADTLMTIALVFNIASLVMALVGAIGLLTMLFISVFERQREIGVMRSVGASSRAIVAQFLTEGLMIGVIAWLFGVPLSYGVALALTEMLPLEGFGLAYPPVAAGLGVIGILVMAGLASIWPSLSASHRTVSDILRYQ